MNNSIPHSPVLISVCTTTLDNHVCSKNKCQTASFSTPSRCGTTGIAQRCYAPDDDVVRAMLDEYRILGILGQCSCVATGRTRTYNILITYICSYVLYNYEIEDDIYELSGMTPKRNSGL